MLFGDPVRRFFGCDALLLSHLDDTLQRVTYTFDHFLFRFCLRSTLSLDAWNRHRTAHISHVVRSVYDTSRTQPFSIFGLRKLIVGPAGNDATFQLGNSG